MNFRALTYAYLAAFVTAGAAAMLVQVGLVLIGSSPAKSLAWKTTSQTLFIVLCIYTLSYLMELAGTKSGMKRWEPLTFLSIIIVFIFTFANLASSFDWLRLVVGLSFMSFFFGIMYFSSTRVGEFVFQQMSFQKDT